jgi:hypothetical protein
VDACTADLGGTNFVRADLRCGAHNGVALSGTIAAMGCPGWEAVFVFRDISSQGVRTPGVVEQLGGKRGVSRLLAACALELVCTVSLGLDLC